MTALDVLRAARERLTPDGAWTQGYGARDANGKPIDPKSPRAVCWCLIGALAAAGAEEKQIFYAAQWLTTAGSWNTLPRWNDDPSRTQAEVLAAFDAAIEAAS